jgi:hypothetical protein
VRQQVRIHRILPLVIGVCVSSCDDTNGPPADGKLVVSTWTEGEDPDQDGYLLAVGTLDTLRLVASDTVELDLPVGSHTLRLLDVAEHCSVVPGVSLEVAISPRGDTAVAFTIACPATGVRVATSTTGLDFDASGYRVSVDGTDRAAVPVNGTTLVRVDAGIRSIDLTNVAPNCTIEGPNSHSISIADDEVVPIGFAVACTAASGVIGVLVDADGVDLEGEYAATVDGARHPIQQGAPTYLSGIAPGEHVVSLEAPANCSVMTEPQPVTITAGGPVRDTVQVGFSVTCVSRVSTVRITATTTGVIPAHGYAVWGCFPGFYCDFYAYDLGVVEPNGTLVTQLYPGLWELWLEDFPSNCSVSEPVPPNFTIEYGDSLDVVFNVVCQ